MGTVETTVRSRRRTHYTVPYTLQSTYKPCTRVAVQRAGRHPGEAAMGTVETTVRSRRRTHASCNSPPHVSPPAMLAQQAREHESDQAGAMPSCRPAFIPFHYAYQVMALPGR